MALTTDQLSTYEDEFAIRDEFFVGSRAFNAETRLKKYGEIEASMHFILGYCCHDHDDVNCDHHIAECPHNSCADNEEAAHWHCRLLELIIDRSVRTDGGPVWWTPAETAQFQVALDQFGECHP
jgi:hypothetical protein